MEPSNLVFLLRHIVMISATRMWEATSRFFNGMLAAALSPMQLPSMCCMTLMPIEWENGTLPTGNWHKNSCACCFCRGIVFSCGVDWTSSTRVDASQARFDAQFFLGVGLVQYAAEFIVRKAIGH